MAAAGAAGAVEPTFRRIEWIVERGHGRAPSLTPRPGTALASTILQWPCQSRPVAPATEFPDRVSVASVCKTRSDARLLGNCLKFCRQCRKSRRRRQTVPADDRLPVRRLLRHDAVAADVDAIGFERAVGLFHRAHDQDGNAGLELALVA